MDKNDQNQLTLLETAFEMIKDIKNRVEKIEKADLINTNACTVSDVYFNEVKNINSAKRLDSINNKIFKVNERRINNLVLFGVNQHVSKTLSEAKFQDKESVIDIFGA